MCRGSTQDNTNTNTNKPPPPPPPPPPQARNPHPVSVRLVRPSNLQLETNRTPLTALSDVSRFSITHNPRALSPSLTPKPFGTR
ncbi:hypothetical protein K402DRAFT_388705 [Aulographum hederae CBS 113979]|uniref:Uncharacterized protein n=1 Tax=Aulographum hederae CBS 113979 TaxID=1176131 RepID=A0A6G1HFX0_9PEZI|nr:hypothetical protein K402DRAFT_388705 [Aulographum hederae CBS 113979]